MRAFLPVLLICTAALVGCTATQPVSSSAPSADQSPLSPYEAALGINDPRAGEYARDLEQLVVQCMAQEGWDMPFRPELFDDYGVDPTRPDDEQWVAEYGYAVWLTTDQRTALWGFDPDYVAFEDTLSASELEAYQLARFGTGTVDDWENRGCQGAAEHELGGYLGDSQRVAEIAEAARNLEQEVDSDPRVAELDARWAECMAQSGHQFEDRRDARLTVAGEKPKGGVHTETDDEIAQRHEQEVIIALDDLRCREAIGFATEYRAVRDEVEQRFVDENRVELDAILAEYLAGTR